MEDKIKVTVENEDMKRSVEGQFFLGVMIIQEPGGYQSGQTIVGKANIHEIVLAIRALRNLEAELRNSLPLPDAILNVMLNDMDEKTTDEKDGVHSRSTGTDPLSKLLKDLGFGGLKQQE